MSKQIIISCIFIGLLLTVFSGCLEVDIPEDVLQFSITNFEVEPNIIVEGETANLSWVVVGGISVNIDNNIGNVSLKGNRIIMPISTTTYTLTALNATKKLTATTEIIVLPAEEPWPEEETSISLEIYSEDTTNNEIKWVVTELEGDLIDGESLILELVNEDLTIDIHASISYSDVDLDDYVSPSDLFTVIASSDGFYYFRVSSLNTEEILFESFLAEY